MPPAYEPPAQPEATQIINDRSRTVFTFATRRSELAEATQIINDRSRDKKIEDTEPVQIRAEATQIINDRSRGDRDSPGTRIYAAEATQIINDRFLNGEIAEATGLSLAEATQIINDRFLGDPSFPARTAAARRSDSDYQ